MKTKYNNIIYFFKYTEDVKNYVKKLKQLHNKMTKRNKMIKTKNLSKKKIKSTEELCTKITKTGIQLKLK